MMTYNWQDPQWPHFVWHSDIVAQNAHAFALEASRIVGESTGLSKDMQDRTLIDLMISEAIKTSQIEGEHFDRDDVRSSLLYQMGLLETPAPVRDKNVHGISTLMIDVKKRFREPLTQEMLCSWQALIISPESRYHSLEIGMWRTTKEPMQVVSGPYGHEVVHFEAPPSSRVPDEMRTFIEWFNNSIHIPGVIRSAVAHLYFESIHPFSDGNGRIGRAISEIALSQELGHPVLLSLSASIHEKRKEYYRELSYASQNGLDITPWMVWFTSLILEAQRQSKEQVLFVLKKARFWDRHASYLNERQKKVITRVLRDGQDSFKGGLTAQKYMKIAECSKATATRDLADLLQRHAILLLEGRGRNTHYDILLES